MPLRNEYDQLALDGIKTVHIRIDSIETRERETDKRITAIEIDIAVIKTRVAIVAAFFGFMASLVVTVIAKYVETHLK